MTIDRARLLELVDKARNDRAQYVSARNDRRLPGRLHSPAMDIWEGPASEIRAASEALHVLPSLLSRLEVLEGALADIAQFSTSSADRKIAAEALSPPTPAKDQT